MTPASSKSEHETARFPLAGVSHEKSFKKKLLFRCAALAMALLVSLLLLEVVFRVLEVTSPSLFHVVIQEPDADLTGHRYMYDPLLGWKNIPHMQATTFGQPLTINAQGHRSLEDESRREKSRPLLILGDSFAWGYGVADGEDFPAQLRESLRSQDMPVINSAVSGWGTDQEYLYYRHYGVRDNPSIVVLAFFLLNDPINNAFSAQYSLQKPLFANASLQLRNVPVPLPVSSGTSGQSVRTGWLTTNSSLGRVVVRKSLHSRILMNCLETGGLVEFGSSSAIENAGDPLALTSAIIGELGELCAQHQSTLVVMKFGMFLNRESEVWNDLDRRFASELQRRARGTLFFDLDKAFLSVGVRDDELIAGMRDGHWSARGHEIVAELLEIFLRKNGLIE